MAYEKRDNSGALFKNDRKEKDTHPDYEGNITVAGVDYWIKAWLKKGQKGTFMSLAVAEKQARAAAIKDEGRKGNSYASASGADYHEDLSDEIPF